MKLITHAVWIFLKFFFHLCHIFVHKTDNPLPNELCYILASPAVHKESRCGQNCDRGTDPMLWHGSDWDSTALESQMSCC